MSARGANFIEDWIERLEPVPLAPEGDEFYDELADACLTAAEEAGLTEDEVLDETPDLPRLIYRRLERRTASLSEE